MKRLSESLIDDVISRSRNNEERKEDEVDLLNCEEMVDYIKSHYEVTSKYSVTFMRNSSDSEHLSIDMDRHGYFWISADYYNDKIKYLKIGPMSYIEQHIPEIQDELKKYFKTFISDMGTTIEILPEFSNKDIIKILDIAIDFNDANDATIKKKI